MNMKINHIKKVLIADDDADDREIFERVLGNLKDVQLIRSMENGREVMEYLGKIVSIDELPNLIILDHNMPMMNGTETLGAIKSSNRYADINVVIYSTYNDSTLQERCHALGASMVLAKPSSMKEYEATIEQLLRTIS